MSQSYSLQWKSTVQIGSFVLERGRHHGQLLLSTEQPDVTSKKLLKSMPILTVVGGSHHHGHSPEPKTYGNGWWNAEKIDECDQTCASIRASRSESLTFCLTNCSFIVSMHHNFIYLFIAFLLKHCCQHIEVMSASLTVILVFESGWGGMLQRSSIQISVRKGRLIGRFKTRLKCLLWDNSRSHWKRNVFGKPNRYCRATVQAVAIFKVKYKYVPVAGTGCSGTSTDTRIHLS